MLLIIFLVLIPLLHTRVPAHRTHINHAIPKLHKRAPLHWYFEIRNIMQQELDQLLVFLFADPFYEAVGRQWHAELVGREPVFREAEVEERGYGDGGGAELFLLLGEVRATDEADGYFLAERGEERKHFGGGSLVALLVGDCGEYWGKLLGGLG
jgi:hypothetical protein